LSASLLGFRAFQYWHPAQLRETVSPVPSMPPCGSVVPLSPSATPASEHLMLLPLGKLQSMSNALVGEPVEHHRAIVRSSKSKSHLGL
jgi:hypothetical protein